MTCVTNSSDIKLAAAYASWGIKQKECVSPVADSSGSLNDKYLEFSSLTINYYVWYNVNGAGTDPALAGKTAIEVAIATDATVETIVAASVLAIETATAAWAGTSTDGLSFYIEIKEFGTVLAAASDSGTTGFTIETLKTGLGGYLGRTSEGIEVSVEVSEFEVKSNQTGETLIDSIQTGKLLSCSMSLLEMTKARWEGLVGGGVGDILTPAGGTSFVGFGTSKDYTSMLAVAGELVLRPVSATDDSENFTFWKSVPVPSSINFSGTDLQVMALEFKAFIDEAKDSKISLGGFGDNTQDLRG